MPKPFTNKITQNKNFVPNIGENRLLFSSIASDLPGFYCGFKAFCIFIWPCSNAQSSQKHPGSAAVQTRGGGQIHTWNPLITVITLPRQQQPEPFSPTQVTKRVIPVRKRQSRSPLSSRHGVSGPFHWNTVINGCHTNNPNIGISKINGMKTVVHAETFLHYFYASVAFTTQLKWAADVHH